MALTHQCRHQVLCTPTLPRTPFLPRSARKFVQARAAVGRKPMTVRGCQAEQKSVRRNFLSLEEAGLVEVSGLSSHEKFLCRLTISSLNLLRVISEQEGVTIEELNAGRVCDWFLKDKLKREQDFDSAVLQWDDSGFGL